MTRRAPDPEPTLPEHHLGYAPPYHLARLHRASGTLGWCLAMTLVLGWLMLLPSFGGLRPIANFAVVVAFLLVLLPWSVASAKSAWRLTDPWPQPSRPGLLLVIARLIGVAGPVVFFCFGLLLAALRMGLPPHVGDPFVPLVRIGMDVMPVATVSSIGLVVVAAVLLWLRAGLLIGRAGIGRGGSAAARLRVGIGLLIGAVGVLALVSLDLVVRHRMGIVDFIAGFALLVVGLLLVLFGWTFGSLHARLSVLIGTIERAEDEVLRRERNRRGVMPGDPSVNEASATPERPPDRSADEIGPIGGHPDPPGL